MNCPEGLTLRSTDVAAPESRAKIDNAKDVAAKIRRISMFTTGCGQNSCASHAVASTIANFLSKKDQTLRSFQRLIFRTKSRLMNTKRILSSVVAAATMLTASVAIAAHENDQARSKTKVRAAKQTTTMTTRGNTAVRTRSFATRGNATVRTRSFATRGDTAVRTRSFATSGNTAVVGTRTASNRTVYVGGSRFGYSYPYGSSGYGYGYPYYSYGSSFGFGYPYSYGYYPYGYSGYSPYDYSYGYYSYDRSGYGAYANGSIVIQVQSRLARAGYYRGAIDGAMGPRTRYAIQAYERDHGLRVDGAISGSLLRNMGLRY